MGEMNWKWIAGFFDGEGCLQLQVMKDQTCSVNYGFQPRMELCQKGDKGREVLEKIIKFFKSKEIDYYYREKDGNVHELVVQERSSIKKWLNAIQELTFQKREQIDIMLNDIIPKIESGLHSTNYGFLTLMELRDELNSLKGENPPNRKYDLQYFENEWDMKLDGERDKSIFDY